MGFAGLAFAVTLNGEVTLAPAVGPDTVKGKSFEPVPQAAVDGSSAVGAGKLLVLAVQVIGTGGVDGNEGDGVGVGVGVGVGLGVVVIEELPPQPASNRFNTTRMDIPNNTRDLQNQGEGETARIETSR
jgi:hypothetical protein